MDEAGVFWAWYSTLAESLAGLEMWLVAVGKGSRDFPLHVGTKQLHNSQKEHSSARPGLYCTADINTHQSDEVLNHNSPS